jgi:hypothetical protein
VAPRRPLTVSIAAAVLVLASCGAPLPRNTAAPTSISAQPPASATLDIEALPKVSLDLAVNTTVCDPEASQLNIDAGEAAIFCTDGHRVAIRAFAAVMQAPIERMYFRRPVCQATPCTIGELSTATVTGWTATEVLSVALDSRLTTVGRPVPDTTAVWPAPDSSSVPGVERPVIKGAPADFAARTPFPFCGRAELDEPPAVIACFRDAVLGRRPAELVQTVFGTEGGDIIRVYRFEGRGAVLMYTLESGPWVRRPGSLVLGLEPGGWDFDPWS